MTIFDTFESILVVNLRHRSDRRREMTRELDKIGLSEDAYEFLDASSFSSPGPFLSSGAQGCFHSHLRALQEAQARGHNVLIMEDDCNFTSAARTYPMPDDWDIFYGGYDAAAPDDLLTSDIIGSHFMGFKFHVLQPLITYLEALLDPAFPGDARARQEPTYNPSVRPGIDGAYVWFRRAHPDFKTVFATPPFTYQRPSRTDVGELSIYDRLPLVRTVAAHARIIKAWLNPRVG